METTVMKKKKKAWFLILPVVVSIVGILLLRMAGWVGNTEEENRDPIKTEFFGMNTYITFTAYGTDAEGTLKEAKQKMVDLEAAWSVTEESSEIYQINHSNGKTITLSEKTAEVINYALTIAGKTDGAFEPTIYPILQAWGFTSGKNQVPDEEKLGKLLRYIGYDKVNLINNQIQVPEGMEIDLGAVGKGYAGDLITEFIKKKGITSALLDIGASCII